MYPNEIDLMMHTVGLNYKKPYIRHGKKFYKPYRNYFNTTPTDSEWVAIMNKGYAYMGNVRHIEHDNYKYDSVNFYLNRAGLDYLGNFLGVHIYDEER
jgi:hypothetical protein